jgi:hypothetical protein
VTGPTAATAAAAAAAAAVVRVVVGIVGKAQPFLRNLWRMNTGEVSDMLETPFPTN